MYEIKLIGNTLIAIYVIGKQFNHMPIFASLTLVQRAKKVSFLPETGPEFPQNDKNPKFLGTNLFLSEFSILFLVFRFF